MWKGSIRAGWSAGWGPDPGVRIRLCNLIRGGGVHGGMEAP